MKTLILIAALFSSVYAAEDLTKIRIWKSAKGKPVKAQLVDYKEGKVTMKTVKGEVVKFDLKVLSQADQKLIMEWTKTRPGSSGLPEGPFTWKSRFTGDATPKVEYVKFDASRNAHLYKTEHFDFYIEKKMTNATVSKCVAVFDSIVGATNSLPLELNTIPKKGRPRYQALLVATDAQYKKLGGIPNSGGFFSPGRNLTVIPFKSMGIVKKGSNYTFDGRNRSFETLVHELTHHSTSHWRGLPAWVEEGLADYMAAMPYRSGSFNFANTGGSIAANIRKSYKKTTIENQILPKGVLVSYSPEHMFNLTRGRWNGLMSSDGVNGSRQYVSAMVLFYYFCRLDDKGTGKHMAQYIHAQERDARAGKVSSANDLKNVKKYLLRGRSYAQLMEDMQKKLPKKGIKIRFK